MRLFKIIILKAIQYHGKYASFHDKALNDTRINNTNRKHYYTKLKYIYKCGQVLEGNTKIKLC